MLTYPTSDRTGRGRAASTSLAILSTYPPTQCGLATFTAALHTELAKICRDVGVVRVVDAPETHAGAEVVGHLINGSAESAAGAVKLLNDYDAVIVQHEYGIFGGPDGGDVLDLIDALTVPVIVVLHTVLLAPTASQRRILEHLLDASAIVVTMTKTARDRLMSTYGADPSQIVVIPHGAINHGATPSTRPASARPLVLTWGLLGPGKGIEWAIDAMAGLRDLQPRYLVMGKTHPKVLERHGETYRTELQHRIDDSGVADLVDLDPSYLTVDDLARLVERADVVLLPYDSREQVTSGVLIEAVAAGRPVVSTAFPHAIELLADGTGLVVPQADSGALEAALRRVLEEPGLAGDMEERAARKAPELFWSAVAARYRGIAARLVTAALADAS
ncbi:MAG: polysaccharide biosynthesis protein PslF [Actinomycetota bacterium]|jgi:glycosyltransferase involved in cell wall biosynthesis|nr:polysaccharide biosynthesis protein PslF [Actinomycetota bacterium]